VLGLGRGYAIGPPSNLYKTSHYTTLILNELTEHKEDYDILRRKSESIGVKQKRIQYTQVHAHPNFTRSQVHVYFKTKTEGYGQVQVYYQLKKTTVFI
jgi:hypothetical protein